MSFWTDKSSDFTAEFENAYRVDTSNGDITATLPNPSENDEAVITFLNTGTNKIILSGYTVNGVSTVKIIGQNDFFSIMVVGSAYLISSAPNYFVSSTPDLWRMNLSILGVVVTVKIT